MKVVNNSLLELSVKELLEVIKEQVVALDKHLNDDDVAIDWQRPWSIYEQWCNASAKIVFYNSNGKVEVLPVDVEDIVCIELVTSFSGYHYFINKTGGGWQVSYQGKFNALNRQNLLIPIFMIDENDCVYSTSYSATEVCSLGEMEALASFYRKEFEKGFSFEDIFAHIHDVVELGVDSLDELDLLEQQEYYNL